MAFDAESGLWAVSTDGSTEYPIAKGKAWREIVGWWDDRLVYLEHQDGDVLVGAATPGKETHQVARLPLQRTLSQLFITRYAIYDGKLALFLDDRPPLQVDLASGAVQELGHEVLPFRCVAPTLSPDRRYMLVKNSCDFDRVRVVDLKTWTLQQTDNAGYPVSVSWSPAQNRWAALAGSPSGDEATSRSYATYVDIGDVRGKLQHLKPDQPLKLVAGPFWSADGARLAVEAEVKPASDSRNRDAVTEIWIVSPAQGSWRKLVTAQSVRVLGWHPAGEYLVLWKVLGSAARPDVGKLIVETGEVQWLPLAKQQDTTQLDESLMVVAGTHFAPESTAYTQRAGTSQVSVEPGQRSYNDALQIRPPYASWIEQQSDKQGLRSTLVVVRRLPAG